MFQWSLSPQYHNVTVAESIPVGTVILEIQATDTDEPDTGSSHIIYQVEEGDPNHKFIIETDPETNRGFVKINKVNRWVSSLLSHSLHVHLSYTVLHWHSAQAHLPSCPCCPPPTLCCWPLLWALADEGALYASWGKNSITWVMQIFLPAGDLGHWWFLPPSGSETHLSQCQYSKAVCSCWGQHCLWQNQGQCVLRWVINPTCWVLGSETQGTFSIASMCFSMKRVLPLKFAFLEACEQRVWKNDHSFSKELHVVCIKFTCHWPWAVIGGLSLGSTSASFFPEDAIVRNSVV